MKFILILVFHRMVETFYYLDKTDLNHFYAPGLMIVQQSILRLQIYEGSSLHDVQCPVQSLLKETFDWRILLHNDNYSVLQSKCVNLKMYIVTRY